MGKRIVRRRTESEQPPEYNLSITDAFTYFITLKKTEGVRERTMTDYHNLFGYFTGWLAEKHPDITQINDITTNVLREYSVYLSEEKFNAKTGAKGLSPYTVNVRMRFLKAFFNALFRENIVNANPANNIKLMKVDAETFEPLTDKELRLLLDAPDDREYAQFRDKVAMYLMLDTGMRINEVCSLEVADVDFKARAIILPAKKNKNRKPRIIPFSNSTMKLLLELIAENRTHFDTTYVFVSNIGTPYQPNSFRKRLHTYRDKVGITKRVSPHVFRHQFCHDFIMNGGDVFTLQRIVGHADISTTRKYIQMTGQDLKDQHAQFSPIVRIRNKYRK